MASTDDDDADNDSDDDEDEDVVMLPDGIVDGREVDSDKLSMVDGELEPPWLSLRLFSGQTPPFEL